LKHILDNFRLIKIGTTQAQRRIFFNLMKEKERIEKQGLKAGIQELAAAMKVKPEEVEEMEMRLGASDLFLDAPLHKDTDKRQIDLLESEHQPIEEAIDQAQFKEVLDTKLKEFAKTLNEREIKIFQDRLLAEVPLTLQAIADEYGVSRERARQLEERIKEKLKAFFEKEGIKVEDHL
jgi:RNA polymerase sigma-32 factor